MKITALLLSFCLMALSAIPASAAGKPVLTIYTYDAFAADWGPGPKIKAGFEQVCHCVVEFVASESSIGILRKIQLEEKNPKADVVLGLDTNIAEIARNTGLFSDHGADTAKLALPVAWSDAQFLPFDYGYFAFVYNSEKLSSPPRSFTDIATTPDNFKIIIQDPRSATPGLGLLLWIKQAYPSQAADIWRGLAPKILTITKGWSEAYGLFLKGEADMVLSYTTSPAYHIIAESDQRYRAAPFNEGHYMQIETGAVLKSSKHQKLAQRFMQFMISNEVQGLIPETNWMLPVIKLPGGLNPVFQGLHVPKVSLLKSGADVANNRKKWIAEWQDALR